MLSKNIEKLITTLKTLQQSDIHSNFENVVVQCVKSISKRGKIIFAGNGGSAADCQHLASEFTGRFVLDREPLPAIALTTDTSALTAIGNDFSIEQIFVRQLQALVSPTDTFVAITTSGNSKNILKCLQWCHQNKIKSVLLSGNRGGKAKEIADISLLVPSHVTARIQEAHILIGHSLIEAIEQRII